MKKQEVRLYNMIFPLWLMLWFPPLWIIVLPANFCIDLLVLWLAMKHAGLENRKALCKQAILKVWLMGFAMDFVGGLCMILWNILDVTSSEFLMAVNYNPFTHLGGFLWVSFCVALTGVLLYFVNKKFCLKKLDITEQQKHNIALAISVFTAPYLFYLPTAWFW